MSTRYRLFLMPIAATIAMALPAGQHADAAEPPVKWTVLSKTASVFTGDIRLSNDALIFKGKKRFDLAFVREAAQAKEDGILIGSKKGRLFRVIRVASAKPAADDPICPSRTTFLVIAQTHVQQHDELEIAAFDGAAEPDLDHPDAFGLCGTFNYSRP